MQTIVSHRDERQSKQSFRKVSIVGAGLSAERAINGLPVDRAQGPDHLSMMRVHSGVFRGGAKINGVCFGSSVNLDLSRAINLQT